MDNKMRKNQTNTLAKKVVALIALFTLTFAMTGCLGNGKTTYQNYVISLMDANYKAEFDQYMDVTGATEEEAQQVYNDGIDYLAEALMNAYGVQDVADSGIKDQFKDLAAQIYSHASYEVKEVTKTDGVYQVTVTVYPIDILVATYDDVVAYIEDMNTKVAAGDYNDYELDDYNIEYANGIIKILTDAIPDIGNGDGEDVTVTIIDDGEYYYISDADFLALDNAILQTNVLNDDGTKATDSGDDASETDSDTESASETSSDTEATEATEDTEAE